MEMIMSEYIIQTKNIIKRFSGVTALSNVSFSVKKGEIHCVVGENGAGKSTLMKILSGVHPYGSYEGDIFIKGEKQQFHTISDSERAKLAIIYQELALIPYMSVYENIFLGQEKNNFGIIDWNSTIHDAKKILKEVGLDIDPEVLVKDIGVGHQQLVEIAKALSHDIDILILDEPTAALNEIESANLLKIIKKLQTQGITSILISHKLHEIAKVADSITILRDGETVVHFEDTQKHPVDEKEIIKNMVGRELNNLYPERVPNIGEVLFEVNNWNVYDPNNAEHHLLKDISMYIKRGEIVGFAGLMGAGRTEFAMSVFGKSYGTKISGNITFKEKNVLYENPHDAIKDGLVYLTEDRKEKGLVLINDIKQNISLASLDLITNKGVIDKNKEIAIANTYKASLNIKSYSVEQLVQNLSGGNQQKVVLSKWLMANPDLLIVDEPTRGIDVGAKFEIYTIMNDIASEGKGVLMISSELPELLGVCDRIYVMHEGKIAGEVETSNATQDIIMKLATGLGE